MLSDRIMILSHGKIQAMGTTSFLKKRFGVGNHVVVDFFSPEALRDEIAQVQKVVVSYFPCTFHSCCCFFFFWLSGVLTYGPLASKLTHFGSSATFTLPVSESTGSFMPKLLGDLAEAMRAGELTNVSGVGIGGSTLEDVFLNLREADQAKAS